MKAIGYKRCSTEGQATEGVSLQTQAEAIRRYAAYKGFDLVTEIEDAGISGGLNKARPGFIELLDLVQGGDVQVIILYSLERLSRDMLTLLALERLLHEYDVELHTIEGQVDTSTPDGFVAFAMKAFMGEMERRTVKYRTKKALAFKRSNGQVFNHSPYGYERKGSQLVVVPSEQAVIEVAKGLYKNGSRLADIVAQLNGRGFVTRTGKLWTPQQVKRVLDDYQDVHKRRSSQLRTATRRFIEAIA
jgi:site-specific DNA recombinase